MTYDLMNRRMNRTRHHTSIVGSATAIDTYMERGMDASKVALGFAFYAKWFTTAVGTECDGPIGCPTALLEGEDGHSTGRSGAVTFESTSYSGSGPDVPPSFLTAMGNGTADGEAGGEWYWDAGSRLFWTWDTPDLIQRKFDEIVSAKGLGGAFALSLAQDSHDWSHLKAMQKGMQGLRIRD